jgi:hypothetical protein
LIVVSASAGGGEGGGFGVGGEVTQFVGDRGGARGVVEDFGEAAGDEDLAGGSGAASARRIRTWQTADKMKQIADGKTVYLKKAMLKPTTY